MKLLFCFECADIKKLHSFEVSCNCGKTKGRYIDDVKAIYSGPGCLLGILNFSFREAVHEFKNSKRSQSIDALILANEGNVTYLNPKK